MSQHSYTRTRKIQIQDVKGSVQGLFPEEEKQSKTSQGSLKKKSLRASIFGEKDRTGSNDRRKGSRSTYEIEDAPSSSRLLESFKQLRYTTQKMYHGDGNLSSITAYLRKISDHILTGRTVLTVQHHIHKSIYDKSFETLLFKSSRVENATKNLTISTDFKEYGLGIKSISVKLLKTILSNLPDRLNHFHFMDIGSGAGRALLIASCYPFKKVDGVEYAQELHDAARSNIAHFPRSLMKCRNVHCHLQEATTVTIPKANTVFLFHAPFKMKLYQEMLDKITHSYKEKPRRFYLIFVDTPDSKKLEIMIQKSHVYERFEMPALRRWRCLWLNPFKVRIYRTVYQERIS